MMDSVSLALGKTKMTNAEIKCFKRTDVHIVCYSNPPFVINGKF